MLLHIIYEMTPPPNPRENYNIDDLNSGDDKNKTCQYAVIFQLWDDPAS